MDVSAQKMRNKYPDKVPVICIDKSVEGIGCSPMKLLVPAQMTGQGLRKVVYEKTKWPESTVLKIGGLVSIKDDVSISDLDKLHMADDGYLYVIAGLAAVKKGPEACTMLGAFHLPDLDPTEFLSMSPKEKDKGAYNKLERVMKKNPDRVPVRIKQEANTELGIPAFEKKLLAPSDMQFSEFKLVIPKYIEQAKGVTAPLLVAGVALMIDAQMSDLYSEHKADDGLLYMAYGDPAPIDEPLDKAGYAQKVAELEAELELLRQGSELELEQVRMASVKEVTELHDKLELVLSELDSVKCEAAEAALAMRQGLGLELELELEQVRAASAKEVTELHEQLETVRSELESVKCGADEATLTMRSEVAHREAELHELRNSSRILAAEKEACCKQASSGVV